MSKQILFGMVQNNLMQCFEMAQLGHFEVAINHLREAISQLEQLQDASDEEPPALQQPTLDIKP